MVANQIVYWLTGGALVGAGAMTFAAIRQNIFKELFPWLVIVVSLMTSVGYLIPMRVKDNQRTDVYLRPCSFLDDSHYPTF